MSEIKKDIVLFVDDEDNVLRSIRRGLFDENFEKIYANSGHEALKLLEEHPVAVLVTDMKMPEMNGLELLRIVKEKYPDIVRIILTAYTQASTVIAAINTGSVFRYITKPWKMESDFIPTIRQALEYYHIRKDRNELISKLQHQNELLLEKNKEIMKLKEVAEASEKRKTKILQEVTDRVIPFATDVVQALSDMELLDEESKQIIINDLNRKGTDFISMLRKVETLLKEEHH